MVLKMINTEIKAKTPPATTLAMVMKSWAPAIRFCQDVLGMDRVLYAMDYPYQFVPAEVAMTDEVPISDADRKKLFQTNAEYVFKL